jgi:glycerate 2-kinase
VKVVAALDSFKGSLDSLAAGEAVRAGVLLADPDADVVVRAVADGGEGTLAAVLGAVDGRLVAVESVDALGRAISTQFGLTERDGVRTAILEAARTIGLESVTPVDETVPPRASSYGLGVQLRAAVDLGVERVLVGLGGTVTTDGGTGLLAALGVRLVDGAGRDVAAAMTGNLLWRGARLTRDPLPALPVELRILTDVTNPLTGPDGAAQVFGPQKGATPAQVALLEERMAAWGESLEGAAGRSLIAVPGAGAAGGIAAALLALGGVAEPGFERIAAEIDLASDLAGADLVITGEGAVDAQTTWGKAPAGIARLARDAGAVVVALGGRVERPTHGDVFDAAFGVHGRPRPLEEAMAPALTASEITATAAEVTRLVRAVRSRTS